MSETIGRSFLAKVFSRVEKPGRYAGGEWNERKKDPRQAAAKIALVFPDVYEIGMSHLGQKILYGLINDRPDLLAERVYAPWLDFESELRRHGQPLTSLENNLPLAAFDILGFSLLYELNYSNILTILDLGGVPLRSSQRSLHDPLVIAGGPAAFNPEPVADFFDLFLIGDGEEAFLEIIEKYIALKGHQDRREELWREMARIPGVYVPSFYAPYFPPGSKLMAVKPVGEAPPVVQKRTVSSFARSYFPEEIIVPNIQVVFDRVAIEVARGCLQKCRFCQATSLYSPHRVKDPTFVVQKLFKSLRDTGYEDASLFSLSVGDYPYLEETVGTLMDGLEKDHISLSLSSLRPRTLSAEIIRNILRVRKTGFTLVPEAGTERLRRVINKNLNDEDIWQAAQHAFGEGWKLLKLYFMIGLPTEREEDLVGIADLVADLVERGRHILKAQPRINLSLSSFIPKPHTPFQWLSMDEEGLLEDKQGFVKSRLKSLRSIEIKDHPVRNSILEAIFSRGDRRLGAVLQNAWQAGVRFDSWRDRFRFSLWQKAFEEEQVDCQDYLGKIERQAVLPWDHIQTGIKKSFLYREFEKSLREERTPSCLDISCGHCGGCDYGAGLEKEFLLTPDAPWPERPALGRQSDRILRYQAFYEKAGPARFISHNDLVNLLQRAFRRAGVRAVFSQGFHPKMVMSYVPALPLGMEGFDESLEFRSLWDMTSVDFLAALNQNVPRGIRFTALEKIEADAPSLTERIEALQYSLDMGAECVRAALLSPGKEDALSEPDFWSVAEERVENYLEHQDGQVQSVTLDRGRRKLVIRLRFTPQKGIRPQDLAAQLLGMSETVSVMARDKIVLSSPILRDSRPGGLTIDRP